MPNETSERAWQFQHSVDCDAPRQFAWNYWTKIDNWNDPPARFHMDGPFDAGSELTTHLPNQTLRSVIREVVPGREAIIDMHLAGAILTFHWKFESLTDDRTRITQQFILSGANARAFISEAGMLEQSAPEGMKKLAAGIERAL